MSVLWCSDLHLKPACSVRKVPMGDDAFDALDQVENLAILSGVTAAILGGDVFDSVTPSGEALFRASSFITRLDSVGIPTYYIEGNHDRVNKNPFLSPQHYEEHRLLSSIGAIPLGTREIDGLMYHGIDYCPVQKLHEKLDEVPECDVLCIHAGFRHLLGFEGAYELTMEDIPVNVRKVVLAGHIHVMDRRLTPSGVTVASSGSIWPWRVTELDKPHGAFIIQPKGTLDYHTFEIRKCYNITTIEDIEQTQAENHRLPPILFYNPKDLPDLDISKYKGVKLIARGTEQAEQIEEIKDHVATSLQEAVEAAVTKEKYPKENSFIQGLLNSDNPVAFVDETLRELGTTFKEVS